MNMEQATIAIQNFAKTINPKTTLRLVNKMFQLGITTSNFKQGR